MDGAAATPGSGSRRGARHFSATQKADTEVQAPVAIAVLGISKQAFWAALNLRPSAQMTAMKRLRR
jgi:hypothetical protein